VANNRYANAARRKRQEKTRRKTPISPQPPKVDELIDNLNCLLAALRMAAESESIRAICDRFVRLATSAVIVDGLTLDSRGWAALLNLANERSFSALKNRRKISPHKPGQTLMFSAADVLRASLRQPPTPTPASPHDHARDADQA
jgi:hypothetical protein